MMPTENQLRWQCCRGMLELDTLLLAFLTTEFALLTPSLQQAFVDVLAQDDMALWDVIQNCKNNYNSRHDDGIFTALRSLLKIKESRNDSSHQSNPDL